MSLLNIGSNLHHCATHRTAGVSLPLSDIVTFHSFLQTISVTPLVRYYSEALPTQHRILCRSSTPKHHRQLRVRVKDLPKVPTRRLERDSNPRPSGRKASTLPMRHHVPCPIIKSLNLLSANSVRHIRPAFHI